MKESILFFSLLLFIQFPAHSQDYKIAKIDDSFFDDKKYEDYLGEVAIIEHDLGSVYFDVIGNKGCIVTERTTRIKILNKDGYKKATVRIPLYRNRYKKENVIVSDAYTYNLANGKIEKSKLNNNDEFLENLAGNYWYVTFTMPNVKEGSVIEYKTKVISPYYTDVPEWFFQYDIPVKYSEFRFRPLNSIQFFQYIKGAEKITQSEKKGDYYFSAVNIPPVRDEGYVSNIDNYRASVVHYFSGYRKRNGTLVSFSGKWHELVKTINEEENFIKQLENIDFLKEIVINLTKRSITDEERITSIIRYLQENYKWNNKISYLLRQNLKDILVTKQGSSAELNFLAIAFLRNAGIKAYPVLLSTKSNGISYMPHPDAFNNVIVSVVANNKKQFLDVTSKNTKLGIIPTYNLNGIGRLIRDNGSSEDIELVPSVESKKITNGFLKLDIENKIIFGTVRRNYSNYEAYIYRNQFENVSIEKTKEQYENIFKVEIDSIGLKNKLSADENIEEYLEIKKENAFDVIGDKIYMSPAFIFAMKENPFKQDNRNYPIDFIYPNQNIYSLTFDIPEAYEIDYVPKGKRITVKSNTVSAGWSINYDEKRVRIKWNLDYNTAYADAKDYIDIKALLEELIKFMDEKIVLKKKDA